MKFPSSRLLNMDGRFNERADPICCVVEISDPQPPRVKVSRRNYCKVAVGPEPQDWAKIDLRRNYLDHFVSYKHPGWCQQFTQAICLGPTVEEDGSFEDISICEAFFHYISLPWKILFAIIPPRRYSNGMPTFFFSLAFIAILIFFVTEIIQAGGCLIDMRPCIQAFCIICIGTSIPDIFTSW
jgi:magnesium/proton exchanger